MSRRDDGPLFDDGEILALFIILAVLFLVLTLAGQGAR